MTHFMCPHSVIFLRYSENIRSHLSDQASYSQIRLVVITFCFLFIYYSLCLIYHLINVFHGNRSNGGPTKTSSHSCLPNAVLLSSRIEEEYIYAAGLMHIGCSCSLHANSQSLIIAGLHYKRGECCLPDSLTPSYITPDLIHCSEARAGIPSCTWK